MRSIFFEDTISSLDSRTKCLGVLFSKRNIHDLAGDKVDSMVLYLRYTVGRGLAARDTTVLLAHKCGFYATEFVVLLIGHGVIWFLRFVAADVACWDEVVSVTCRYRWHSFNDNHDTLQLLLTLLLVMLVNSELELHYFIAC